MQMHVTYTDKHSNDIQITPNTEWTNYGDINPQKHGGRWVRWENDMWHIVTTRHPNTLPDGMVDNEHLVRHTYVELDDVFVNGNPNEGPTDMFTDILDSHRENYVTALVDYDIEYFIADYTHYIHSSTGEYPNNSDYWDHLETYDIEQ